MYVDHSAISRSEVTYVLNGFSCAILLACNCANEIIVGWWLELIAPALSTRLCPGWFFRGMTTECCWMKCELLVVCVTARLTSDIILCPSLQRYPFLSTLDLSPTYPFAFGKKLGPECSSVFQWLVRWNKISSYLSKILSSSSLMVATLKEFPKIKADISMKIQV